MHNTEAQLVANDHHMPQSEGALAKLQTVAEVALETGKLLMEAGACASSVERIVQMVAHGFGAERVDLRIGYASLTLSIGTVDGTISRICRVGNLGVNQNLIQKLWIFGEQVTNHQFTITEATTELRRLATETPRHSPLLVAFAVGLACAAFGLLLGVDWRGTAPVFVAATLGQCVRHMLLRSHVNIFVCSAFVSLVASVIAGLAAQWTASTTLTTAMIASILLLVPGVPAVNAQSDILDGYPTLGSARAVTVAMTLIFISAGLWLGKIFVDWRS